MPKITFFLRSNNDLSKTFALYCRVSLNSKTSEFSLKEKVNPIEWNQDSQRLKSKNKEQEKYINTLVNSVEYKLKQIACINAVQEPKKLISMLQGKGEETEPPILLTEIVDQFIKSEVKTKQPQTIRNHYIKLKNLKMFQDHVKTVYFINPSSSVNSFDLPTAERFKNWFMDQKRTTNVTSASRCVELFKNAFHFAVKKGFIKTFELSLYRTERDPGKQPVYLTTNEVERLIKESFISSMYERVRDLYLFQISTGLSFSDIWGNWQIKQTEAGTIITGTRTKNKQSYFVPINEVALTILEKYNGQLPKYENQTYNRVLKEIAEKVGIKKRLSTHTGRKTFASLMDQDGWSIESIAKMLGHSSIKTTETYYIGQSHRRVLNEMLSRTNK